MRILMRKIYGLYVLLLFALATVATSQTNDNPELQRKIEVLIRKLGDQDTQVKAKAVEELADIGNKAIPALMEASKNPSLKKDVVCVLVKMASFDDCDPSRWWYE